MGDDVYPPDDAYLRASTETGHTSTSKLNQARSLLTQEFNPILKKEREANSTPLAAAENLKFRMSEMEKTMALMNKKIIETGTGDGAQGP